MPTGVPTEVGDLFDDAKLAILAIGTAALAVILTISGVKWLRGAA